jgi:hypothetical protein
MNIADPNAEVTTAILEAEWALDEAIKAWERVEKVEAVLSQEKDGLERDIAHRGTSRAGLVVEILKTLRGEP